MEDRRPPRDELFGFYYLGFSPEGTYKFGVSGHMGYQAEAPGVARLVGTILTLEPTQPVSEAQRDLPTSLQVVRWGDRVYLIPDDKGPRFADSAVHHWEPRTNLHGDFLLREPDWGKPVRGMPELPAGWRPWLIESVIEARITRSLARHRAEIGVGSRQRVSVGLILRAVSSKYGWTDVSVVSVSPNSSVIENAYGDQPLLKGLRISSRAH